MSRPFVVIADDNEWVRQMVKTALDPHFEILASVSNGKALVAAVVAHRPDAVVADVAMPVLSGLEAMFTLRHLGCMTPFVMISADADAGPRCLGAGAAGFVNKWDIAAHLAEAVSKACATKS